MIGSFFDPEFFRGNRNRLRQVFTGTAPIIITANGLLQRNGDSTYEFRQDSNFWYLTGIGEPDIVLVIDKDKEYLIVPLRDDQRAAFDGQPDILRLAERAGIETIFDESAGWKHLAKRLGRVKHIATQTALASYEEKHGFYANPARARLIARLKEYNDTADIIDLRALLARLRVIKQPEELRAIKRSIKLTCHALTQVKNNLSSYEAEREVEAKMLAYFRKRDANMAYKPIIASDANACTLHYVKNNDKLGDRLLIDVGAEVENYAADITRTYSLAQPDKRFVAVHAAVLSVHEFAMDFLRPGVIIKNYENQVQEFMGEKLRELGLIKSISTDTVRQFYPHSTSHFLGLDVHDAADYKQALAPGMVLTVEPGIYIPKEGIGVRIEDDVLITSKGSRNLSRALSTDLD